MAGENGVLGMPASADVAVPRGKRSSALLLAVAALSTLFFIVAVLYGTWLNYSPVPLSDSWEGVVGFYLNAIDNPGVWWQQHNEHRILISKLFFWLDMRYLGGSNVALIALNVLLMLAICATFQAFGRRLLAQQCAETRLLLLATLLMLGLSWIQRQNITWEFQNQFYWVYLLPLLASFAMARALEAGVGWLALSLACGAASAFSMVNGVFVLPILAILAIILFRSWRRVLPVALVAVACLGIFLLGYERTPGSAQGMVFLREHPLTVVAYIFAYLGNPFFWIFGRIEAAIAGGILAVALVAWLLSSGKLRRSPYAWALFAYLAYIACTAVVTAFGRAHYSLELAASSRYTTPALSLWSALLLLVLARLDGHFSLRGLVRSAFLAVLALLGGQQLHAFYFDDTGILFMTPYGKEVVAIGLQMGVHDPQALLRLSPFAPPGVVPQIVERARLARVSIFVDDPLSPAAQVGRPVADLALSACSVEQLRQTLVDPARSASTVEGIVPGAGEMGWRHVYFVDDQSKVSGVGRIGRVVFNQLSQKRGRDKFDGYLLGNSTGEVYCQ